MMGIDAFVDSLCSILGKAGCYVRCQYARKTKSRYLVVSPQNHGGLPVKVRISDHPAPPHHPVYDFYFYPTKTHVTPEDAANSVVTLLELRPS